MRILRELQLTHCGRVIHICISKLTIGSDNGLSPGQRHTIIWTNARILSIHTLGTNFYGILNEIHTFSITKMYLKILFAKWHPFCLGLNILNYAQWNMHRHFCVLFCCAHVISSCGLAMWIIYPYSLGLLHWHWGNRMITPVPGK